MTFRLLAERLGEAEGHSPVCIADRYQAAAPAAAAASTVGQDCVKLAIMFDFDLTSDHFFLFLARAPGCDSTLRVQ